MGVDVEFRRAHDLYVMGGYCEGSEAPEGAGYAGLKSGCNSWRHDGKQALALAPSALAYA